MDQKEREQVFLSPNGIREYFHNADCDNSKLDAQNKSFIQLSAFGDHFKLWLNPTEGILAGRNTPTYIAKTRPNKTSIRKLPHLIHKIMTRLYEDLSEEASLAVNNNPNGRKEISGVIGMKNLGIRSLPKRLVKKVEKYRRPLDGIPKSDYHDHHYHVVYKIAPAHLVKPLRYVETSKHQQKRFIPSVVYPEILVVIGHDLYQLFNKRKSELIPYILAFWNGVDMNYRNLENPKYRLNIAGILIAMDSRALEYMAKNMYSNQILDIIKAVDDFGKWLFKQNQSIPINSYDAAITMTSYRLYDPKFPQQLILGIAFISNACTVNVNQKNVVKTGVIGDNAGFEGIRTAAHELGHLLGAEHDGSDHLQCPAKYGQIMSGASTVVKNSGDWSNCSLSDLQSFLESNKSTCLFNIPKGVGRVITRYLPGKIQDANAQCRKITGTNAIISEKICQNLICASLNNYTSPDPAADGTSCGNGKLCLHLQCISEDDIN
ncbi:hypothetical protein PV328_005360 [Microctonus aethiopoides]|uniref:Peptidase M12B domain-containing protein n=1 Tax=Microctonus aethiopoides TaxID=144406 RepID=A0AA39FLU7_9HYME|nr:hypothetical protein PV328_005360 [Microctonus aethiopoides]